ncbi:MAG: PHP domain-containing protein [Syntrophothermus sp.]|uniref:CehA/McbA family metallohydrolase n=1 Tax=Syntrophothermus sp. TaxID=2736299 RepID=UPI00257C30C1|nr:CehA/McbA family metallohydrolase [Syntrophothermus sp.]NSW83752.1 PHP domain-containing protein [Syntrophothermus sp.]
MAVRFYCDGEITVYEYVGNIHLHTEYSDGSGSVDRVVEAAARAGLDFIVITDHNTLRAKEEEGYHKGVLVLVGMELNYRCNHYLVLNVSEPVPSNDKDPQAIIDEVRNRGGIGFIAHPVEKGSPFYEKGLTYPWTQWDANGFTGIEIWNRLSQWRDGLQSVGKAAYLTVVNPHAALVGPYQEVLSRWDELLRQGMVVAIGGSDCHGINLKLGPVKLGIDDYYLAFRSVNTHILSHRPLVGKLETDAMVVYDCLVKGSCFIAYDFFLPSRGFLFWAQDRHQTALMGQSIAFKPELSLYARTAFPARVDVIRDGAVCWRSYGRYHSFKVDMSGVYRVEVWHELRGRFRPWIYSNPIFVVPQD